jgi:uncharacterized coiled-coil protein SlyX
VDLDKLSALIPLILSVFSTLIAVSSFWHKARTDRKNQPVNAAGAMASASQALSTAYERRLQELEEATTAQAVTIAKMRQRISDLEEMERGLCRALRTLGEQVEENGLTPAVDWRKIAATLTEEGG